MEFLGYCIGISIVLWIVYFFLSVTLWNAKNIVETKKNIDKIKRNRRR